MKLYFERFLGNLIFEYGIKSLRKVVKNTEMERGDAPCPLLISIASETGIGYVIAASPTHQIRIYKLQEAAADRYHRLINTNAIAHPSNILPSMRTPIVCLISIPNNFIFPACRLRQNNDG